MAELSVRNVCVIGAGTMGGGIAAHLANLGFKVSLLDEDKATAQAGLDRARQARQPLFYVPERAADIRVGSSIDELEWASEADWVCEAIVERLDAKRALFAKLQNVVPPDTIVTTNTSGLQIELLSEGLSGTFREQFFGAHFFNPPRYLRLLELIPTPFTKRDFIFAAKEFFEKQVARRVVLAKDTPGFIANRFGMWSMFKAIHVAEELHLSVEAVDAITGPFLGRPKTGSFRLNDIVGLDVMADIATNLMARCSSDPEIQVFQTPESMFNLMSRDWLGDKTGHGYYRREGRELFTLDLNTFAYRTHQDPDLPTLAELQPRPLGERLREALDRRDEVGEFLREYLIPTLRYADRIKEEISHSILDFDRVMMWGFGWTMGPFAMIDAIGHERLGISPTEPFYHAQSLRDFTGAFHKIIEEPEFKPLESYPEVGLGNTYRLRDLGDGVTAIVLTTKMGVITPQNLAELTDLLTHKVDKFVLTSEARSFSAGFDLHFFGHAIDSGQPEKIEEALLALQTFGEVLQRRHCAAAIFGHCLGAGLELALSCPTIVAAAECQIGLPESRVGLIPGGRGTALMRIYNGHSIKRLTEVAVTLAEGTIAPNADAARQLGYLRPTDVTVYNPDSLIFEAKKAVLESVPTKELSWPPIVGPLVGMIDRELAALRQNSEFTEYDEIIGGKIRQIFAKSTDYEDALRRERTEFVDLCNRNLTHARIRHMLSTGKPMRN